MEEKKLTGTYHESTEEETWIGRYYECNECGFAFMLQSDLTKCYCPNCGRYIIWNEAIEGVDYDE